MTGNVLDLIQELSRRKKQAIAVTADAVMLPLCLWAAFALRLGLKKEKCSPPPVQG